MKVMGVSSFVKVCPVCNQPLESHSINALVNCGLRIVNSNQDKRTAMTGLSVENKPVMNSTKDVSENEY